MGCFPALPDNHSFFNFRKFKKTAKTILRNGCFSGVFVRMEGLEPPCPKALDPKSSASTNFATSAKYCGANICNFLK